MYLYIMPTLSEHMCTFSAAKNVFSRATVNNVRTYTCVKREEHVDRFEMLIWNYKDMINKNMNDYLAWCTQVCLFVFTCIARDNKIGLFWLQVFSTVPPYCFWWLISPVCDASLYDPLFAPLKRISERWYANEDKKPTLVHNTSLFQKYIFSPSLHGRLHAS